MLCCAVLCCVVQGVVEDPPHVFHVAEKKIPHAGPDGKTVVPTKNNGIKLESFIFDVFPRAVRPVVLEVSLPRRGCNCFPYA